MKISVMITTTEISKVPRWLQHIYDNTVAEAQDAGKIEYDGKYDSRGDLVLDPTPILKKAATSK